jgi:hypothetical protein
MFKSTGSLSFMEKRKNIGLLINEIDGNFHTPYWLAMKNAAEKFDCNLFAFEGRFLDFGKSAERQHNVIYKLANPEGLWYYYINQHFDKQNNVRGFC